jgi:hypothetical protein
MAIGIIHQVFPGAQVEWERTDRVAKPMMVIDETTGGDEVAVFLQRDMSDDYRGPGVDLLKKNLLELKNQEEETTKTAS